MTLRHEDTLELLDGQASVLQRIADGDSLGETLCSVALLLEQLMPGSCCTVLLLNPESRTLHHGAAPSLPDTYSSAIEGMSIGPVAGSCGTAAYLQEPVIVGDIVNDPRWADFQQLAADHGLRSCWSTPIWSRSQVVGTFAVYHFDPHLPTGRESELVSRVSYLASLAINHADGERERRARLEADAAREAADAASRTKSAFIANLSHELRTPLQAITGFTELLSTLSLSGERRQDALRHMEQATSHLLTIVEDALDISRVEAGTLKLDMKRVDVLEVTTEAVDMLSPIAERSGVVLANAVPVRTECFADHLRLRQVLLNLVANAVRYAGRGSRVTISTAQSDTHTSVVVSDTGPGIAQSKLDRLFIPFDRLDADGDVPGVGLGLVLAQQLVEAMGGQICVTSEVGRGAQFTVELRRP